MKFITSLNPNNTRYTRQLHCVNSWLKYGYEILAIQPHDQVDTIKRLFPEVTVIGTGNVGHLLNKPNLVEIHTHLSICKEHNELMILINSDIELLFSIAEFDEYWGVTVPNTFKIGIRWNHDHEYANLCPYGIDTFQITPEMADLLPNHGFVIGCPTWDYWIVYHLHTYLGYTIHANKQLKIMHELHTERWSQVDYNNTSALFNHKYSIDHKRLSKEIAILTGRDKYIAALRKRRYIR